ncbi:MAG: hypothetical protein C0623_01400 [Desulfuromonas sp.]|nr:MAG: hypothetical protein C0623_01400 [Desulfuromonas sp.]
MIKRVCTYCKSELGTVADAVDEVRISHGICLECLRENHQHHLKSLDEFLETVTTPLVLVDDQRRVVYANSPACNIVGKELDQVTGLLGGEFIDCVYAADPEGCGAAVHCQSCVIRREVEKTALTGFPSRRVPAILDLAKESGDQTVRFLISTEKIDDVVFVQIDEVEPF